MFSANRERFTMDHGNVRGKNPAERIKKSPRIESGGLEKYKAGDFLSRYIHSSYCQTIAVCINDFNIVNTGSGITQVNRHPGIW